MNEVAVLSEPKAAPVGANHIEDFPESSRRTCIECRSWVCQQFLYQILSRSILGRLVP